MRLFKLIAAMTDAERRKRQKEYILLLLLLFDEFYAGRTFPDPMPDYEEFIAQLKKANERYAFQFADDGYHFARGMYELTPPPWRTNAARFVNSFADGFGIALKTGQGKMDFRRRAGMYGETVFGTAWLNGIQAAMFEQGAKKWRRVLHPELSKSGPCPLCEADAEITHDISEPFVNLHPQDVCSMEPIGMRFSGLHDEIEYGIPGITGNALTDLLGPGIVRRRTSH